MKSTQHNIIRARWKMPTHRCSHRLFSCGIWFRDVTSDLVYRKSCGRPFWRLAGPMGGFKLLIQLICHYGAPPYPPNMQNILDTSLHLCKSQPASTHLLYFSTCSSSSSEVRSTTSGPSQVSSPSLICSTCSLAIPVSSESSFSARVRP